jgi:hypothetical protein
MTRTACAPPAYNRILKKTFPPAIAPRVLFATAESTGWLLLRLLKRFVKVCGGDDYANQNFFLGILSFVLFHPGLRVVRPGAVQGQL